MLEEALAKHVQQYLEALGYHKGQFASNVRISYGQIADFIIYDRDTPRIVVDIKATGDFPAATDPHSLRFDSHVRKIQSYAITLNAPYYLITNGKLFLWFITDDLGRPQLLDKPVLPSISANSVSAHIPKEDIVRVLQELRKFLFYKGVGAPTDEAAIIIYAKLLSERGDNDLKEALIASRNYYNISSHAILSHITFQDFLGRPYYAEAFELLKGISFANADARDVLSAMDDVFISGQIRYDVPRIPRWLADFLVLLSRVQQNDIVLDIFSGYGDILAAILMSSKQVHPNYLWGICSSAPSALWTQIQQLIIDHEYRGSHIVIGEIPPYDVRNSSHLVPTCVIAAPPFGRRVDTIDSLPYRSAKSPNRTEDLYLELAIEWVERGGRVIMLVPEGLLFSESRLNLRRFVLEEMRLTAIIGLRAFLASTNIKTSVLVLDKKDNTEPYEVFIAQISEITVPDTFNSRKIPQLASIINAFERWVVDKKLDNRSALKTVPVSALDISNLTASHYLTPSLDQGKDFALQYPSFRLAELTKDIKRGAKIKLYKHGDLLVIGPSAIRPMLLDPEKVGRTVRENVTSYAPTVQPGDVVFNSINTHRGEAAVVDEDLDGALISQHAFIIKPDPAYVLPEYLAIVLNSDFVRNQNELITTGAVIPALNVKAVRNILIPVPDIGIQKRIIARVRHARNEYLQAQEQLRNAESNFISSVQDVSKWEEES